ncbi:hypothetical protein OESDEN_19107, partial [Oesophagostomum dentatum]
MALHALKNCRYTVGNGAQVLAMPYKIRMPKFKVTSQPPMKQMLQQLGISRLFCDGCDLKGVCESEDLFVDDVIHKAVVE